jgi:transposase
MSRSHRRYGSLLTARYVAEHGCKCRGPAQALWHTIYARMNRWAKAGVLDRVFTALQEEQLTGFKGLSLDSIIVKVFRTFVYRLGVR